MIVFVTHHRAKRSIVRKKGETKLSLSAVVLPAECPSVFMYSSTVLPIWIWEDWLGAPVGHIQEQDSSRPDLAHERERPGSRNVTYQFPYIYLCARIYVKSRRLDMSLFLICILLNCKNGARSALSQLFFKFPAFETWRLASEVPHGFRPNQNTTWSQPLSFLSVILFKFKCLSLYSDASAFASTKQEVAGGSILPRVGSLCSSDWLLLTQTVAQAEALSFLPTNSYLLFPRKHWCHGK